MDVSRRLSTLLPKGKIFLSESGISKRREIEELEDLGFAGFLVGTSLMKNPDPGSALRELNSKGPDS